MAGYAVFQADDREVRIRKRLSDDRQRLHEVELALPDHDTPNDTDQRHACRNIEPTPQNTMRRHRWIVSRRVGGVADGVDLLGRNTALDEQIVYEIGDRQNRVGMLDAPVRRPAHRLALPLDVEVNQIPAARHS